MQGQGRRTCVIESLSQTEYPEWKELLIVSDDIVEVVATVLDRIGARHGH